MTKNYWESTLRMFMWRASFIAYKAISSPPVGLLAVSILLGFIGILSNAFIHHSCWKTFESMIIGVMILPKSSKYAENADSC